MVLAVFIANFVRPPIENANAILAYETVKSLLENKQPAVPSTKTPSQGVFVTIESEGKILGCRGTLEPSQPTLELEIQKAARSATQFDPRYHRVNLKNKPFAVTVTIVSRQEPIGAIQDLLPEEGLVLRSSKGVGVVLPWEGRDPNTRLTWAYKKANTAVGTSVVLKRLIAERFRYPEI
jgi:AMMECR1 domain-containing protein